MRPSLTCGVPTRRERPTTRRDPDRPPDHARSTVDLRAPTTARHRPRQHPRRHRPRTSRGWSGRPPRFASDGGRVDDEMRRRMFKLYQRADIPAFLDAGVRKLLEEGRADFAQLSLATNSVFRHANATVLSPGSVIASPQPSGSVKRRRVATWGRPGRGGPGRSRRRSRRDRRRS